MNCQLISIVLPCVHHVATGEVLVMPQNLCCFGQGIEKVAFQGLL